MIAVSGAVRPAGRLIRGALAGGERKAKIIGLLASLACMAGFVLAGWSILPQSQGRGEVKVYMAPQMPLNLSKSGTIPVFVMRDDRSAIRHGLATPLAGGLIEVEFFRDTRPRFAAATDALLFEPGLPVLWAVASDASHEELQARARAVQDEVGRTLERVMGSSVFNREYRPVLRAILTDAVASAWQDDRAKAALENIVRSADPIMREMLRTEAGQVLQDRLSVAFWEFLKANWTGPIELLMGGELDYAPLTEGLVEVFHDPTFQESLVALGTHVLEAHESRVLAERLVIGTVDALLRDGRVPEVAATLISDVRFHDAVRPLSEVLFTLATAIPRHLGGLGRERTLNPLAAHVFKAMTLNTRTNLIMFVTPENRARIEVSDPAAAILLEPAGSG